MRYPVVAVLIGLASFPLQAAGPPVPEISGDWWTVAGDPDLGPLTSPRQQPVDFAIWQAADGTWQLWSCIRNTQAPGKTRLFHRWEGKSLTETNWTPMGIAMEADPGLGETEGGLQAPYVFKVGDTYQMVYGDWEHICLATSKDGKQFARQDVKGGRPALFTDGIGTNTRDPMAIQIGDRWHCYYTAYPNRQGAVYCRTSSDLREWTEPTTVAFGGKAETGPSSAECPFVVRYRDAYYLFRTQRYGKDAQSCVYRSTDPMNFGLNQDRRFLIGTLPVAAPEIVLHDGRYYVAALRPDLKGIQIAQLRWVQGE
jgi:hypothetical protein